MEEIIHDKLRQETRLGEESDLAPSHTPDWEVEQAHTSMVLTVY